MSRIKYEHSMIGGLRACLEQELEPIPEIRSIIPGRISRTRGGRSELRIRCQYETETGARLIARGPGVVQEVFIVTSDPEGLRQRLSSRRGQPRIAPPLVERVPPVPNQAKGLQWWRAGVSNGDKIQSIVPRWDFCYPDPESRRRDGT